MARLCITATGKMERWSAFGAALVITVSCGGSDAPPDPATVHPSVSVAGPVTPWPRPVPVRLEPTGADDLFVTTLGFVETPLADGMFDPVADRIDMRDGRVFEDYYRDSLEIAYFTPLDKSIFPLPPSGWCSWYYYFQEVDAPEILENARWLADELKPYGARYVQIDDGWQGTGHGLGENRDWTTIDVRFREPGMAAIADSIRRLGFEAGLWLAPHGQSNEQVARESGAFLWTPEGLSAADTWEGTYLLDPSIAVAHEYLLDLFGTLRDWGYTYFKIDGQPIVLEEYATKQSYMKGDVPFGPADEAAAELYRISLGTIREAIGSDSYLLGCWGIPLPAIGKVNGSRTAGDVFQGWAGFLVASEAVQRWNFLHNIAWYSDPDVMLVRPPLTEGMARAWATIQGLSGQALMASDRMTDLPESRVELLRRVYPATDIRPLDLFRPRSVRKPIWDLKVSHLGRQYDVVGVFNYEEDRTVSRRVAWDELGLDPEGVYHVYDFWQETYLGAWEDGVFLTVPPADVRVITLVRHDGQPTLLSTDRHITQGWVDLLDLDRGGPVERPILRGRSRVVAGDPYTLVFGLPRGEATWRIAGATARTPGGRSVGVSFENHQGYATVRLDSPDGGDVSWETEFEAAGAYLYPVVSPSAIRATQVGLTDVDLQWPVQYHVKAGYRVEVDGVPRGVAFETAARIRGLEPGHTYRIGVRSIWYDGSVGDATAEVEFTPTMPEVLWLADQEPISVRQGWGQPGRDATVDGNPLRVAGVQFERGLGTHAESELRYAMHGAFTRFLARVGVDDEVSAERSPEVVFEVWGDGRRLWSSPTMTRGTPPVTAAVDVRGVKELVLRVGPGGDGIDYDHADWGEARLER